MHAPRLLPVHCEGCDSTYLAAVGSEHVATCRDCGSVVTVLPGEAYSESDVPLFNRIEAATKGVVMSQRRAERIVEELIGITTRQERPEAVLLRVLDFVPTLYFLVPALHLFKPSERPPLLRASGMLLSIFTARLRRLERLQAG